MTTKPYGGGRVFTDDESATRTPEPQRVHYRCFADSCPMPGTIFPSGPSSGVCAWHYGCMSDELGLITRVLQDWTCLSTEIVRGRATLRGKHASNPKVLRAEFEKALRRVRPAVAGGGWGDAFEPKPGEDYAGWIRRISDFLDGVVSKTVVDHRLHPQQELPA